jgi:DNA polymerase-3 subunit epsilon
MENNLIFYDTETTGTKPGKDRITEIAAYDPKRPEPFCTFSNPECPIPQEVTAINGISDEMVKDAPTIQQALAAFVAYCPEGSILVAHNNDAFDRLFLEAEFQRAALPMPKWRFFDTLKWSRKYRGDLPRHALQFLRETYGIEANQAHRALDDVIVLYKVFLRMTDDLPAETILALIDQKSSIFRMPFGKYAGKTLQEVPSDYLDWLKKSGALDKKENFALREALEKG